MRLTVHVKKAPFVMYEGVEHLVLKI